MTSKVIFRVRPLAASIAVIVAALGTVYLAWFLGSAPWVALTLAVSFGTYGLLRKRLDVGPMLGLLWETVLIFLPALAYIFWLTAHSSSNFLQSSLSIDLLLVRDPNFDVTPDTLSNVPLAYLDREGNVGNVPLSRL